MSDLCSLRCVLTSLHGAIPALHIQVSKIHTHVCAPISAMSILDDTLTHVHVDIVGPLPVSLGVLSAHRGEPLDQMARGFSTDFHHH